MNGCFFFSSTAIQISTLSLINYTSVSVGFPDISDRSDAKDTKPLPELQLQLSPPLDWRAPQLSCLLQATFHLLTASANNTSALQRRVLLFQMPVFPLIIITESFRAWIYPHGRQLIWTLFPPQHTQMFWLSGSTHQNQINENMDKNIWISKKSSKNSKKK